MKVLKYCFESTGVLPWQYWSTSLAVLIKCGLRRQSELGDMEPDPRNVIGTMKDGYDRIKSTGACFFMFSFDFSLLEMVHISRFLLYFVVSLKDEM